jgi:hypothetical protein
MTPNEENQIRVLNQKLSQNVKITLFKTDHDLTAEMQSFCETLSQLVPKIQVKKDNGEPEGAPMIGIGDRIRFQGIPSGNELDPFLEALSDWETESARTPESSKQRLKGIALPAVLTLFVAPQCKYCPQVMRQLLPLPEISSIIKLIIIDGTQFPTLMQKHKIQSVPTLFLDDEFRWTGSVDLDEIIDLMIDRNPSLLGASSLEMMLKDGNANQLTRMMVEEGKVFPAYYDVLTHHLWSTRLGAMVVMEELIEESPALAEQVIKPLSDRFTEISEQAIGDVLYIFGEIGSPAAVPALENVIAGKYSADVKEAAEEALAKIKNHA